MKQEDKELLLKDLCVRLPHNCRVFYEYIDNLDNKTYGYSLTLNTWCINEFIANKAVIKPYLRPISSMTEEEKKEYGKVCELDTEILANHPMNGEPFPALYNSQDWLNAHYFDYRGLIEKGLALEATSGMYNFKHNQYGKT